MTPVSRRAGPLLVRDGHGREPRRSPGGRLGQIVVQEGFEDETWTDGMIDVRSLDLSRTSITNGGFAGNGLEVVIPEGGFRGLGPLDRLAPGTDGSLVSVSHPLVELERRLRRQAPRAGRPLFVIGTGLHPTNRELARLVREDYSAAREPKECPEAGSRSGPTSITQISRATAVSISGGLGLHWSRVVGIASRGTSS